MSGEGAYTHEMIMAHTMFRREFGLIPALVRRVPDGDTGQARIVADHVRLIDGILLHHHEAEDTHLWPRLVSRGGADLAPLAGAMESQHEQIHTANTALLAALDPWAADPQGVTGAAVAGAAERLFSLIVVHLAQEEDDILPFVEKYITPEEWQAMAGDGAADFDPELLPLAFGLMMYEGDPATVRDTLAQLPPGVGDFLSSAAPAAFAEHAKRVHGTATPPRTGIR